MDRRVLKNRYAARAGIPDLARMAGRLRRGFVGGKSFVAAARDACDIFSLFDRMRSPNVSPGQARLQARRAAGEDLQRYWPEFAFGTARATCRAMQAADAGLGKPGLVFGAGLLRAHARQAQHQGSCTILAAWDGRSRTPGLGARLLAAPLGPQDRQAGAAVASAVVAERVGACPGAALPSGR